MIAMLLARGGKQRSKQGYISLAGGMMHARSCRWCRREDVCSAILYEDRQGTRSKTLKQDKGGKGVPRKRRDEAAPRVPEPIEQGRRYLMMMVVWDDQVVSVDLSRGGRCQI